MRIASSTYFYFYDLLLVLVEVSTIYIILYEGFKRSNVSHFQLEIVVVCWIYPKQSWIKLNCDDVCITNLALGGCGGLLQDSSR